MVPTDSQSQPSLPSERFGDEVSQDRDAVLPTARLLLLIRALSETQPQGSLVASIFNWRIKLCQAKYCENYS